MKRLASAVALAVSVLLPIGATPASAQEPIHVTANATHPSATPGGFQEVGCQIDNLSGEPVLVLIDASVTYADGEVQRFHLNQGPTLIEAGQSFVLFVFFQVPEDAALGTATFTCEVRAVGAAGGGFVQSDTATFEVVAA